MLNYLFDDVPESGQLREIVPGVYWLRMPLPMALDHINLYLLEDADGWWIIDTGIALGPTQALWETVFEQQLKGKPVKAVVSTHHHPDHVLGNQAFKDVPIGALQGTTTLLREQGDAMAQNMYRMVGDWMRGTEVLLPSQTVTPGVQTFGNHRLRLLALSGHTGADLAILDETTGVLFAGDLVFYQRALTTPNTPGLSVWLADIATLQGLPWKVIVPGHGPVATDTQPFAQMREYLGWLDQLMATGAANGNAMGEMIRSPIPERFAGISLSRYELIRSVSHLYSRYERERMTRMDSPRK